MTSLESVYDAFLSKITEDEWGTWTEEEVNEDLRTILDGAIPYFKFPRVSLEIDDTQEAFIEDITNEEIQILAQLMKCEWLNRTIMTWENVKPLYVERDFSQANLLSKLKDLLEEERYNALKLERVYYRSINSKPYSYSKLAGDANG